MKNIIIFMALAAFGQQVDWVRQVKNKPNVDLRDYGAKGDGSTDDATAIQAAVNALTTGGTLFVPKGTYIIGTMITIATPSVTITCASPDVSVFKAKADSNMTRMFYVYYTPNLTISNCGFDGQTHSQVSGDNSGIFIEGSPNFVFRNNIVKNFGSAYDKYAVFSFVSRNTRIEGNRFASNAGVDVQISNYPTDLTSADGAMVINNIHGSPRVQDANTATNWWDTGAAGWRSISFVGVSNCTVTGNMTYGGNRKNSTPFTLSNPIIIDVPTNCVISDNTMNGMGNGHGVVSVTQGSGTITGTNTFFSTEALPNIYSDVGKTVQFEGDDAFYKITAVASINSITVTPVVVRTTASSLRYKINSTGDLLTVMGAKSTAITGNTATRGGDNGYSLDASFVPSGVTFEMSTIANNVATYNCTGGIVHWGATEFTTISGNTLMNNGQCTGITPAALRSGLVLDPTDSGMSIKWLSITGNVIADTQVAPTQVYAIGFNPYAHAGKDAFINNLTYAGNRVYGHVTAEANKYMGPFLATLSINGPIEIQDDKRPANSEAGSFNIRGETTNHRLAMGVDTYTALPYAWLQSSLTGTGPMSLKINPNGGYVILTLPTACTGPLPTGTIWNDSGTLKICP